MSEQQAGEIVSAAQDEQGRGSYALMVDGETLGELQMQGEPRYAAILQRGEDRYLFHPTLEPPIRVDIRKQGAGTDYAVYNEQEAGDGNLELHDGRRYRWARADHANLSWLVSDEGGQPLICFTAEGDFMSQRQATISLEGQARQLADLDLLLATGWYVILIYSQSDAAESALA